MQAPKREHPVLMLSGIGTNAIGFDLDSNVSLLPFPAALSRYPTVMNELNSLFGDTHAQSTLFRLIGIRKRPKLLVCPHMLRSCLVIRIIFRWLLRCIC